MGVAARFVLRTFARNQGFAFAKGDAEHGAPGVTIVYGGQADAVVTATAESDQSRPLIIPADGSFFHPESPGRLDFAALLRAAQPGGLGKFVSRENGALTLRLDIIAAAFWCLTRAEERTDSRRDPHGRFLCAYSAAPPEFYDVPVVNRWFENLGTLLRQELGLAADPPRERQTIALTHDIDLMRKYAGAGSVVRGIGRMLKNPAAGLRDTKAAAAVNFSGQRDPYDSFDDLYAIKERISAHSTFFMMTGSGGQHDCDYRLEDANARNLLLRARTFGDEIGVHPGWDSGTRPEQIASEVREVERANGQPVLGSRQHYLRFEAPQTWRHLAAAGVKYDSSMGFPDRSGFRCGWSGVLRPYDVEQQKELDVLEIPLVCMDVTLAAYEKIPAELCLERLTNLLDASTDHVRGGAFVFLWHNSIADRDMFPGYWDTFEYFFSIASGSARFVTLASLCEEYAARETER
jgi:hypothetical protein